jgi:hypothetical protein
VIAERELSQLAAPSPGIDAWLFQMHQTGHALRIEDNPRSVGIVPVRLESQPVFFGVPFRVVHIFGGLSIPFSGVAFRPYNQ